MRLTGGLRAGEPGGRSPAASTATFPRRFLHSSLAPCAFVSETRGLRLHISTDRVAKAEAEEEFFSSDLAWQTPTPWWSALHWLRTCSDQEFSCSPHLVAKSQSPPGQSGNLCGHEFTPSGGMKKWEPCTSHQSCARTLIDANE